MELNGTCRPVSFKSYADRFSLFGLRSASLLGNGFVLSKYIRREVYTDHTGIVFDLKVIVVSLTSPTAEVFQKSETVNYLNAFGCTTIEDLHQLA